MSAERKALIDPEAVAQLLGISVRGVYRLASAGELPFHRVGRQMRFNPDELLAATRAQGERRPA